MSDSSSDVNPLDALAEEFVARHRRGEHPSLTEYAERHPELADDIRDLFPGLVVMEGIRPEAGEATGAFGRVPERLALEHLGDYRILREVGRGGMGVVYEAEQVSLGRHVALKVLPTHGLMNPTFLERFRREAKAAARLHHTNIVPVFGVGEEGGIHYYAMQFIQGQGLDQVLQDLRRLRKQSITETGGSDATAAFDAGVAEGMLTGQFQKPSAEPPPDADSPPPPGAVLGARSSSGLSGRRSEAEYYRSVARVGLQTADALAYAHHQGILHRDIKPSNLLLDMQGTVWITDFGLAKAEGGGDLTHDGDIVGTVRFMAPERFDGNSLPQSDLYSLGLAMYELLTLRSAFEDNNKARLIERVLHEPPVPPRKVDAQIPRDLETIVLKCLAKDVQSRYATGDALAEDLRRFLADRPIRARRAGPGERLWRWCRRNPAVASLVAAVVLLLVAVASVSTFAAARLQSTLTKVELAEWETKRALTKMEAALATTATAERQARLREADALVGKANGIRNSHRPGQRFEALAALEKAAAIGRELGQPAVWFDTLRNEAIAALALPDIQVSHSWPGFPAGTYYAEVNGDFTLYARTTQQGACSVRRIADDSEVFQLPPLGEPAKVRVGPGQLLVLYGYKTKSLQLWDLAQDRPVQRLDQRKPVDGHSFRHDGRQIALGYKDGFIEVFAADTGKVLHRLAPAGIPQEPIIALHPAQPILAACSYRSQLLEVRDLETGAVLISRVLPWRGSFSVAWSNNGQQLAVADGYGGLLHLYAFDPNPCVLRLACTTKVPATGGLDAFFNPADDRLAVRAWGGYVHVVDAHTGRLLFSTGLMGSSLDTKLVFDPSGLRLAAVRAGQQEERLGWLSIADSREYRALGGTTPTHPDVHLRPRPAVHPGGRLVALRIAAGVALYDLETGSEVGMLKTPQAGGVVYFDGAGNLLDNTMAGLFRWPVRSDPERSGLFTVGPPQKLPFNPGDREIAASSDGRVVAQSMYNGYGTAAYAGGWIWSADKPLPLAVDRGTSMHWGDVSADGQWVAFGLHDATRVNVYAAATGKRVWQSPSDGHYYCRFSPDGRWLLTDSDGGRAYAVGTWAPGPRLGPGRPFDASPDGRLVAMGQKDGVIRLVELATGRELARLEDPERIEGPIVFTSDGTQLVVGVHEQSNHKADGLRVWDLCRIRRELVKLGLDWDAPAYSAPAQSTPGPIEVRAVGGELILQTPQQLNSEAWKLVAGSVDQRDPARALELIQKALQQDPANRNCLNTLGVVQYRLGNYAEAMPPLEKSLAATAGKSDGFALFFLAMCHAKLGAAEKAKDCFDRALQWRETVKGLSGQQIQELQAFRIEAISVLGLK